MTTLSAALREIGTAKEIGRLAGVSHRTVERWMRDEADPPASALLRLMSKSRRFWAAIARLTDDDWLTHEAERLDRETAAIRARLAARRVSHAQSHTSAGPPPLVGAGEETRVVAPGCLGSALDPR